MILTAGLLNAGCGLEAAGGGGGGAAAGVSSHAGVAGFVDTGRGAVGTAGAGAARMLESSSLAGV